MTKENISMDDDEKRICFDALTAYQLELDKLIVKEQALKEFKAAQKTTESRQDVETLKQKFL